MNEQWVFDPIPPSGRRTGGRAAEYGFECSIGTLVRESVQNSLDAQKSEDKPVEMKFRIVELDGDDLARFLDAAHWGSLADNLEAIAHERGGKPIEAAIQKMKDDGKLRLLVIEDRNTKGLSGTERRGSDQEKNSFCALVRDELYSDKHGDDSLGSFGLGKSLLWAYSGFDTVLFSSVPFEPPGSKEGLRFIGRTCLPYHETAEDGRCTGDGWLGVAREPDDYDKRHADSVWGNEAEKLARDCKCHRENDDYGLSAVVVGFSDPELPDMEDAFEVAAEIKKSVLESFWPAISTDRLSVVVEVQKNEDLTDVFQVKPGEHPAYQVPVQLLQAFHDEELEEKERLDDGESTVCRVDIFLPERVEEPLHDEITAKVAVLVKLIPASDDYELIRDRIFRFRSKGMVVRDKGRRNLSIAARPYVALVLGGQASGDIPHADDVDRFLRAAEPQAHDKWTSTRALKNEYKEYGTITKLKDFEKAIQDAIRDLVSLPEKEGGGLPKSMMKFLRFGGTSGGGNPRFMSLAREKAWVEEDHWKFSFHCRRNHPDGKPWQLTVRLKYSRDGGGSDDIRALSKVKCKDASDIEIDKGMAVIDIPGNIEKTKIEGRTDSRYLPSIGTRAAVKLRVDGRRGGDDA